MDDSGWLARFLDWLQRWQAFWSTGVGTVLATLVGWLTPAPPPLVRALLVIGVFFIGIGIAGFIAEWVRGRLPAKRPPALEVDPPVEALRPFDPRSLFIEVASIDLTHFGDEEPYMIYTLNVRNASGYPIRVEHFAGEVRFDGSVLNAPPQLVRSPRNLTTETFTKQALQLRQSVSQPTSEKYAEQFMGVLYNGRRIVPVDLSSVRLVGSYGDAQRSKPLPDDCYLWDATFVIRGPIWGDEDAAAVFKAATILASQNHFDVNSMMRNDEAS